MVQEQCSAVIVLGGGSWRCERLAGHLHDHTAETPELVVSWHTRQTIGAMPNPRLRAVETLG